jgi:hypothetical protein
MYEKLMQNEEAYLEGAWISIFLTFLQKQEVTDSKKVAALHIWFNFSIVDIIHIVILIPNIGFQKIIKVLLNQNNKTIIIYRKYKVLAEHFVILKHLQHPHIIFFIRRKNIKPVFLQIPTGLLIPDVKWK